jgi:hypothetical protein
MAKAFPPAIKRAGYIDTLSGDFVPAIDLWAPLNLSALIAKSEVLALGPLTLVEHELEKGSVVIVQTEGLNLHGGYGFVYLKSRPLSPAARAYMTEIRAHEQLLVKNEARLEKLYRHTQRRTHT